MCPKPLVILVEIMSIEDERLTDQMGFPRGPHKPAATAALPPALLRDVRPPGSQ